MQRFAAIEGASTLLLGKYVNDEVTLTDHERDENRGYDGKV